MKLHIMTWNTQLYEHGNIIAKNLPVKPIDDCKYKEVFGVVKKYIDGLENAVAVLQEIPYNSNVTWNKHTVYEKLLEIFPKEKYEIFFRVQSEKQILMTVAIALKDKIKPLDDNYYPANNKPKNRAVAVEINGVSILGIHAENGEKNKSYLNSLHGKADIILGDFNAGDYIESENRNTFNQILKEHIGICNMPTKVTQSGRRTCIDHVFVRKDMVDKCFNLIVHEEIKLSDHFPVTFEYEID
ncbi:MAG: hypothetical protein IJD68_04125 [Ruminococcus sp.]|nr:hypothetical protein [Ruminococcus sp.]